MGMAAGAARCAGRWTLARRPCSWSCACDATAAVGAACRRRWCPRRCWPGSCIRSRPSPGRSPCGASSHCRLRRCAGASVRGTWWGQGALGAGMPSAAGPGRPGAGRSCAACGRRPRTGRRERWPHERRRQSPPLRSRRRDRPCRPPVHSGEPSALAEGLALRPSARPAQKSVPPDTSRPRRPASGGTVGVCSPKRPMPG